MTVKELWTPCRITTAAEPEAMFLLLAMPLTTMLGRSRRNNLSGDQLK